MKMKYKTGLIHVYAKHLYIISLALCIQLILQVELLNAVMVIIKCQRIIIAMSKILMRFLPGSTNVTNQRISEKYLGQLSYCASER